MKKLFSLSTLFLFLTFLFLSHLEAFAAFDGTQSVLLEQIADIKIENIKFKSTIAALEKAVPESPQACTSALTKSGDDPFCKPSLRLLPLSRT